MDISRQGLNKEQRNKIIEYYRKPDRPIGRAKMVKWASRRTQHARFKALKNIGDLTDSTVLDVGCGLGDLLRYLQRTIGRFDYTGIDLMPEFIVQAQAKYPKVKFLNVELSEIHQGFDYVLASGVLSTKIPDYETAYKKVIKQIYNLSSKATGFNMLNILGHPNDECFCVYNPKEIINFCNSFCSDVRLVENYLSYDFTIFLYH